jgi:hypothetical protein
MGKSVRDTPSPRKPPVIASMRLHHPWADAPRGWTRTTLVIRWRLRGDGSIWSRIEAVLDRRGRPVPSDQWPPVLDPGEAPELDDGDRIVQVPGDLSSEPLTILEDWLVNLGRAHDLTPAVHRS